MLGNPLMPNSRAHGDVRAYTSAAAARAPVIPDAALVN
jgi:hypothetical protein